MCLVAFLMGFAALVYEVAWTRVLALMLGASVYAFSMMLLAFLLGIAGGGYLGGRLADSLMKQRLARVITGLAVIEVAVGCRVCVALPFSELPFWYVFLFDWFMGGHTSSTVVGIRCAFNRRDDTGRRTDGDGVSHGHTGHVDGSEEIGRCSGVDLWCKHRRWDLGGGAGGLCVVAVLEHGRNNPPCGRCEYVGCRIFICPFVAAGTPT